MCSQLGAGVEGQEYGYQEGQLDQIEIIWADVGSLQLISFHIDHVILGI